MNIIYLHQYFRTPSESGGTRSYEFARRLVARGHTVHMITSTSDEASDRLWRQSMVDGIYVHAIAVPYANQMPYRQRTASFVRFAYHAAGRAARLPADVVLATSTPLTIALPAVYASRRRKVPMVFEVRDLWPEMPIAIGALKGRVPIAAARWLERFAYRHSAQVIALSPGMRDGVASSGFPADRISVIPNSCDLDLFVATPEQALACRQRLQLGDRPLVTYAGSLGVLNGVGYLARLAAAMRNSLPEVAFVVAGDGKESAHIRALSHDLGVLGRNFYMLGTLPKADMPLLLSASTLAVSLFIDLPEMWKNSANKFFDALAAGRPVAINYQGWQADLLRESGAGIVLPPDHPAAAARLLAEFLSDPDRLNAAGKAARHLAETRFSRDLLFDEFERVLKAAVEGHHAP
ncbi:MAG: glycosyltransferase family 4 protein [Anaerolineae bacterium]